MKIKDIAVAGLMLMATAGAYSQVYPLSENTWTNPDFVKRFLGSYGVLTEKEPQITSDESKVFQTLSTLLAAGDSKGAIAAVRTAAATPDASAALDYTLGNLYLQAGEFANGIRAYEVAIRKFPNFQRAYKNAALAHIQSQNFAAGAEYMIKSIELGGSDGDSFGLLGYCYLNLEKNASALDAYRMAGVLAPNNKDWQLGKATTLQRVGLHEESLAKFDQLIAESPRVKNYYTAAANSCISLQDDMRAAKYLELAVRRGVADEPAKMLLGDIYLNQKLYDLSVGIYGDLMQSSSRPDYPRFIRYARGLILMGAIEDASTFVAKIEERANSLSDSQRLEVLNLRSKIAFATGDDARGVASLEEVIKLDPTNGEAILLLGEHYFGLSDWETALFYFERAQKMDASAVDGYVQAARVKVSQRKFADAVDLLQKAQSIKPQAHVESYLNAVRNALKTTF
jgi:tetratricopeptide (TPR) repeat protein